MLSFTLPTSVKMQEDLISGFNSSKYFVIVTTGVQIKMISQPETEMQAQQKEMRKCVHLVANL